MVRLLGGRKVEILQLSGFSYKFADNVHAGPLFLHSECIKLGSKMYICIKTAFLGLFCGGKPSEPEFQKIGAYKSCKLVRILRKLDVSSEKPACRLFVARRLFMEGQVAEAQGVSHHENRAEGHSQGGDHGGEPQAKGHEEDPCGDGYAYDVIN